MTIEHKETDDRGIFYIKHDSTVISELTYIRDKDRKGVIVIDHTETKIPKEGRGYASKLVERAVEYAREKSLKIDPLCPFAEIKFEENDEYQDVRAS
ncbi:GNAT family N-acetyltransferase [Gangjinia marincola]|uniref:GNAT family N-acetyltransferase n=1 Tax=Gangjinia marincola TaxID=578463 RepID=A0ABN1MJF0_9FLAO